MPRCRQTTYDRVAFCFTAPFMLLAFLVSESGALKIFNYLTSCITLLGGLAWVRQASHLMMILLTVQICILSSHIAMMRAMKVQGVSRETLPWKAPFQPYFSYISLSFTVVVCVFKGFDAFMPWNPTSFVTNYIGFALFAVGYFGYKCELTPRPRGRIRLMRSHLWHKDSSTHRCRSRQRRGGIDRYARYRRS